MAIKRTQKTVAQQVPFLYVYFSLSILLAIVNAVILAHAKQINVLHSQVSQVGNSPANYAGMVLALLLYLAVGLYLILSRSPKNVTTVLKVLLGFQLLGIVLIFLSAHASYGGVFAAVVEASLTFYTLQLTSKKNSTLI